MHRASISDAKNNLSALIDRVRRGETVLICDRKRPVARLQPVGPTDIPEPTQLGWSVSSATESWRRPESHFR